MKNAIEEYDGKENLSGKIAEITMEWVINKIFTLKMT